MPSTGALALPCPHSFPTSLQMAQDVLSKFGREASLATGKTHAFCRTGRSKHRCVFTTMRRPVHPSATSIFPCKVQGNGKLAWISPLLEGCFIYKWCKKHPTAWYDLSWHQGNFQGSSLVTILREQKRPQTFITRQHNSEKQWLPLDKGYLSYQLCSVAVR